MECVLRLFTLAERAKDALVGVVKAEPAAEVGISDLGRGVELSAAFGFCGVPTCMRVAMLDSWRCLMRLAGLSSGFSDPELPAGRFLLDAARLTGESGLSSPALELLRLSDFEADGSFEVSKRNVEG